MPSRLMKIIAAVEPLGGESNIMLKVCSRCQLPQSIHDTTCKRCAKRAKRTETILKTRALKERQTAGEKLSKDEMEFLNKHQGLLDIKVKPEDLALLEQKPFNLPEDTVYVRPTFKNRLQFFIDRMRSEGRLVTTTFAAAKQLNFDSKDDFVNFATDHGVKSLMSADWKEHYAVWSLTDIIDLNRERQADLSAGALVEKEPGNVLSSIDAAHKLGMASVIEFVELATDFGVKPAGSFGDKPEQKAWRLSDVEALRHVRDLETRAHQIEEKIQRIERDIAAAKSQTMKYQDMLAYRKKNEELKTLGDERAKIELALEEEAAKLHERAMANEKAKAVAVPEIKASRLERLLTLGYQDPQKEHQQV